MATQNQGKIREMRKILTGIPAEILSLKNFPSVQQAEETGNSFEENAALKAVSIAKQTGLLAIADDSGLEVDALNGQPGIYSSRFAGPDATDEDRNQKLLQLLEDIPEQRRTARYRAVIAIATPEGEVSYTEGRCEGRILREERGDGGFGYDPLFLIPEYGKTMAELEMIEKNKISHRGKALKAARATLEKLIGE